MRKRIYWSSYIYRSLAFVCRVIKLAKRLRNRVVDSIIYSSESPTLMDTFYDISKEWRPLIDRYLPLIGSTPLCQGITWSPSWKALPSKKADGRKKDSRILTTFQVELYILGHSLSILSAGHRALLGLEFLVVSSNSDSFLFSDSFNSFLFCFCAILLPPLVLVL